MELRQLKYFAAVADTLSFSRAADTLYMSQSSLSKQISDLEHELDVKLFERNNRSVTLTESGQTLLAAAKSILLQTDTLYDTLHAAPSECQLRIGIQERAENVHLLHYALAEELYDQTLRQPGLRIHFSRLNIAESVMSVANKDVDLGIIFYEGKNHEPELETQTLLRDEYVVLSRSDTALEDSPESIRKLLRPEAELVLIQHEMTGLVHILSILDALDCHPRIRFAGSFTSMILSVECGNGVTILPYSIYRQIVNRNTKAYHIGLDIEELHLLAIWRKDGNPLVKEVVKNTIERIREHNSC